MGKHHPSFSLVTTYGSDLTQVTPPPHSFTLLQIPILVLWGQENDGSSVKLSYHVTGWFCVEPGLRHETPPRGSGCELT